MRTPLYNVTTENLDTGRVMTHMDCTPDTVNALCADDRYNVILISRLDITLEERAASVLSFYRGGYID